MLSEPFMHAEWGKQWELKAPVRYVYHAHYSKKEHEGRSSLGGT